MDKSLKYLDAEDLNVLYRIYQKNLMLTKQAIARGDNSHIRHHEEEEFRSKLDQITEVLKEQGKPLPEPANPKHLIAHRLLFRSLFIIGLCIVVLYAMSTTILERNQAESTLNIETMRTQITQGEAEWADHIAHMLWSEVALEPLPNHYKPQACPWGGYGLAWNVMYKDKTYTDQVLVFSDALYLEPDSGGWVTWVCLNPGIELTANDVGAIQTAILQKKYHRNWDYVVQ